MHFTFVSFRFVSLDRIVILSFAARVRCCLLVHDSTSYLSSRVSFQKRGCFVGESKNDGLLVDVFPDSCKLTGRLDLVQRRP